MSARITLTYIKILSVLPAAPSLGWLLVPEGLQESMAGLTGEEGHRQEAYAAHPGAVIGC